MRLQDAGALLKLGADLLDLVPRQRLPPDRLAALGVVDARPSHANLHPAPNDRAPEFRKHTEHLEHRSARRRGPVESLLMQIEIASRTIELFEETDQVLLLWGFVPYRAKDFNVGFANINAKAEGSRTSR